MSYKKFNLETDISYNSYYVYDEVYLSSGSVIFPQVHHFSVNNVSASYFADIHTEPNRDSVKVASVTYGHLSSSMYHFTASLYTSGEWEPAKSKIYRLMAQRLLGNPNRKFILNNQELDHAIFILFARNQFKDGTIPKTVAFHTYNGFTFKDSNSIVDNEFCGPFTYLKEETEYENSGIVFHKAGIVVFDPTKVNLLYVPWSGTMGPNELAAGLSGSTYNDLLRGIGNYFSNGICFSSSVRVQTTIFKCTAAPSEFNYSSNPSFKKEDGEIITHISSTVPATYITQIGLLGPNQELIAYGKLRKPIRKTPNIGVSINVRLPH